MNEAKHIEYLGSEFVYPPETLIGDFLEAGKGWDAVLAQILPALVECEEPVICEVGSNIGASLMQMLRAKPRARAFAFEPSERFLPYLRENLRLGGVKERVTIYPWAAGAELGQITLHNNDSTATTVTEEYGDRKPMGSHEIHVVPLGGLPSRVDFLKADIDGAESDMWLGAKAILDAFHPVLHFEFAPFLIRETKYNPTDQLHYLRSFGYERFLCLTATGERVGMMDDPDEILAWADGNPHRHGDLVSAATGTKAADHIETLLI